MYYIIEKTKTSYIKRVIALPGEHVQIKDGYVWFKRYCQELYEHLGHTSDEENKSDKSL